MDNQKEFKSSDIAVIGMSCRFPGAADSYEFWQNIKEGMESIRDLSDEEIKQSIEEYDYATRPFVNRQFQSQNYVKRAAVLEDIDLFDASFFGYNPNEAELIDPQQRIFLEIAWQALENAGYDSENYDGVIGVYAGTNLSRYFLINVWSNRNIMHSERELLGGIGSEQDYVSNRVSYKLNLQGPAITVQTACSTSLVAVHMACQSLLNGECDTAIAGGVRIHVPHKVGYLHREGEMTSPEGYVRAFDADAKGTVFSRGGAGCVVLKRFEDAQNDGDCIHAVIKGSAVNNDGSFKAGYTAPSVDGQAMVISDALAIAGVDPGTITYIEAHGTGTPLGDPIEINALAQVYSERTDKKQYCAIGSVKTNIGHLAEAAGIASFIKTVLLLEHRQIAPSLNFEKPNPRIDFENSPFYVNTELTEWKTNGRPRRAGVSAFGVGGTNAHVVLEEAPAGQDAEESARPYGLLLLSAKTETALKTMASNLSGYFRKHPDLSFSDVIYTLQVGRRSFKHRLMLVCRDLEDAADTIEVMNPKRILTSYQENLSRSTAFMFSGQGSQYVNMGRELYQNEVVFRKQIDVCSNILMPLLKLDLRHILYHGKGKEDVAVRQLQQTRITQPTLFVIEYALARLWMHWGVHPDVMIGHSIGEYSAACLAGVFSLEDALSLVAARGRLMQGLPAGSMLSVPLSEEEIKRYLDGNLALAAVNAPNSCVVSGPTEEMKRLGKRLQADGLTFRRLRTSHAFHSAMMDTILEEFTSEVKKISLNPPRIPYISNLTGTWIAEKEATDPMFWVKHIRRTVRFSDGIGELLKEKDRLLLEIGPGNTLSTLTRKQPASTAGVVCSSLPHPNEQQSDRAFILSNLGRMWLGGAKVDWSGFYDGEHRNRIPLPTYPFECNRYWVDAKRAGSGETGALEKKADIADWFYVPSWKRSIPLSQVNGQYENKFRWMIFADEYGLGKEMADTLRKEGMEIILVHPGRQFSRSENGVFTVNAGNRGDYEAMFKELATQDRLPDQIAHLWNLTPDQKNSEIQSYEKSQESGFYSLLFLAQTLGTYEKSVHIGVVSDNLAEVNGEEELHPEKATVLGPVKVIPLEYPHIKCANIDVVVPESKAARSCLIDQVLLEIMSDLTDRVVAYRGKHRWVQTYEPIRMDEGVPDKTLLKEAGTYLITGGLGGLGLVQAEYLAKAVKANLVLTGRSPLPPREQWEDLLNTLHENDQTAVKIRKVQALESLGSVVLTMAADVTEIEDMQKVLNQARELFGTVNGVIHSAGTPGGGIIQLKTREMAERVIDPKVKGALVLHDLLKDEKIDFLALNSSLFSITGGFGQVDYCAANSFLDVFASYNSLQNGHTVSINWDAWEKVGMAVNLQALPPAGKIEQKGEDRVLDHPFLERCVYEKSNEVVYATDFSAAKHWVLNEHRINGNPIIPGTAYLEMARAAFEDLVHVNGGIEIQDVFFLTPLEVAENTEKQVRTVLRKGDGGFYFRIISEAGRGQGGEPLWQEHAVGKISAGNEGRSGTYEITKFLNECNIEEIDNPSGKLEILPEKDQAVLQFGRRWNSLRKLNIGENQGLYLLELADEFHDDLEKLKLHPALLDMATGPANGILMSVNNKKYGDEGAGEALYLPLSYKLLKISKPLTKEVYSYSICRKSDDPNQETVIFDVLLLDKHGNELVAIEGFTLKKVSDEVLQAQFVERKKAPQSQKSVAGTNDYPGRLFSDEEATEGIYPKEGQDASWKQWRGHAYKRATEGIYPEEGKDAFGRVLSVHGLSQVAVCTSDLSYRIQEIRGAREYTYRKQKDDTSSTISKHPRPNLGTLYVAPRNELEQTLAEIWQAVLGIEEVGIYDNFFELGADSVLGIQFVSRAREANIALAVNQLFELPTITDLAAIIKEEAAVSLTQTQSQILKPDSSKLETSFERGDFVPSDFPDAEINQKDLDSLLNGLSKND